MHVEQGPWCCSCRQGPQQVSDCTGTEANKALPFPKGKATPHQPGPTGQVNKNMEKKQAWSQAQGAQ